MTDFRTVRALYGETQLQFGRRLGFDGPDKTVERKVRRYENGETPVAGLMAKVLELLTDKAFMADSRRRSKRTATEGKS